MDDLIEKLKRFREAISARDYLTAVRLGGEIVTQAAGVIERLTAPRAAASAADAAAERDAFDAHAEAIDAELTDLERCKPALRHAPAAHGGASVAAVPAAALNPAVVLAVIEAVAQLARLIRDARGR